MEASCGHLVILTTLPVFAASGQGLSWPLLALVVFGFLGWACSRWKVPQQELEEHRGLPLWRAYLIALLVTGATFAVRIALDSPLGGRPTLVMFALPIMLSAYLGGVRAGLLATAGTFFGASYFLLAPFHSFAVASDVERWQQFFIAITGVCISLLCELLHRARRRAEFASRQHLQAEAGRRESETRYQTLFDYAPEGIAIANLEGRYLDANPTLCRMLGYSREEIAARSVGDVVVHAELTHITSAFEELGAGSDHHREWQFRCKDGSVFAAEVTATQMPNGLVMGVVRDITERKLAEVEILKQLEELRRWQAVTLGREGRVLELKEEINQLLAARSEPARYQATAS